MRGVAGRPAPVEFLYGISGFPRFMTDYRGDMLLRNSSVRGDIQHHDGAGPGRRAKPYAFFNTGKPSNREREGPPG